MFLQMSVILFTGGMPGPGGVPGPRGGGWSWGVPDGDPPGWLLLRAVRILLECILVVGIIPLVNSVAVCFTPAKYCYYLAHLAGGKNCMKLGALISDIATGTSPAHQHNGVVRRCAKWILCGSCTPQIGFEFSTWVLPKATAHHHSGGG